MDFGYTSDNIPYDIKKGMEEKREEFWAEDKKAKQLIKKLKREDELKNIEARRITEFIRPEILAFAEAMEKTMRSRDPKKGDSYKTCAFSFLGGKLQEEYLEVEKEVYNFLFSSSNNLKPELVDLSNCCAMLWNRNEVKE